MILRAEHLVHAPDGVDLAFATTLASDRRNGREPSPQPTKTAPRREAETVAYVNHGRWVADCPFCPSAQVVSPEDPRFFCTDCRNLTVGGRYVAIAFPGDLDAIERALDARLDPVNRNWVAVESVAILHAENETFAQTPVADAPTEVVRVVGRTRLPGTAPGI